MADILKSNYKYKRPLMSNEKKTGRKIQKHYFPGASSGRTNAYEKKHGEMKSVACSTALAFKLFH